jgi:hypothetical protein
MEQSRLGAAWDVAPTLDAAEHREAQASLQPGQFVNNIPIHLKLQQLNATTNNIYCVPPLITYSLRVPLDNYAANTFLEQLTRYADDRDLFLPVTDGRFHWTSLVYRRKNQEPFFEHYNSLGNTVSQDAENIVKNLNAVGFPGTLVRHDMPRQSGADCGLNVLAVAEKLAKHGGSVGNIATDDRELTSALNGTCSREALRTLVEQKLKPQRKHVRFEVPQADPPTRVAQPSAGTPTRRRTTVAQNPRIVIAPPPRKPLVTKHAKRVRRSPMGHKIVYQRRYRRRVVARNGSLRPWPTAADTVQRWNSCKQRWDPAALRGRLATRGSVYAVNNGRRGFVQCARRQPDRPAMLLYYPPRTLSREQNAWLQRITATEKRRGKNRVALVAVHDGRGKAVFSRPRPHAQPINVRRHAAWTR